MPDSRPAGRPIEFLPAEKLEAVMRLFWERGYEATSLQDLETCTGLARSSLYNTFGSKHELFAQALQRYQVVLGDLMFTPLEDGHAGLDDIHGFLDRLGKGLGKQLGAANAAGCLMVNTMVEFGDKDQEFSIIGRGLVSRLHGAMLAALGRSACQGEIAAAGVDSKTSLLVTVALGVNVASRSGAAAGEILALIDAAHDMVRAWRTGDGKRALAG
jgi:TetR/AcrR family transcriptional regulator, transcriptional repressor for nem operon